MPVAIVCQMCVRYAVRMADRTDLEALSAKELHDRAFAYAERHVDLKFFFDLLTTLPAAEAAAGAGDRSNADIFALRALAHDLIASDEGALGESLRPFYIEYLARHEG